MVRVDKHADEDVQDEEGADDDEGDKEDGDRLAVVLDGATGLARRCNAVPNKV